MMGEYQRRGVVVDGYAAQPPAGGFSFASPANFYAGLPHRPTGPQQFMQHGGRAYAPSSFVAPMSSMVGASAGFGPSMSVPIGATAAAQPLLHHADLHSTAPHAPHAPHAHPLPDFNMHAAPAPHSRIATEDMTPTRSMPAFGESIRNRCKDPPRDEEAAADVTTNKSRDNNTTAYTRIKAKAKLKSKQCLAHLRALTPVQFAKLLAALLAVLLLVRFAVHSYEDRTKYANFTIVSLMHDMSPESLAADKAAYAFQYTALASWSKLVVGSNILVFVDSAEQCPPIESIVRGVQCYAAPCRNDEYNKPLLNCVLDAAHQYARTDILAFASGDVALYSDLAEAIETVAKQKDKFVMVGRRTNALLSPVMVDDFRSPTFTDRLRTHAKRNGQLHSAYGIDLFVYRKNALSELKFSGAAGEDESMIVAAPSSPTGLRLPPFLAGVYRWDNWLLSQAILDDSVTVIDMTSSVLFVHQESGREKQKDRIGATYNDALVKSLSGSHYKIGTIDNAGFLLQGHSVVPNPNVTDVVLFTKKASKSGYLVILTVNHNYINLALNWVCWADRIKFTNFILIAEDQSSATNFRKRGVAVIVRHDAPWIKKAGDYGSVEFQETMTFRTEFLMSVLTAGFHFVTADMDGLWLDDPLRYFNDAADLQGQMHKVTKISGGLVIVRATQYGRYFWNMVIECQRANARFLATAKEGTYVAATYTEQYCINELSRGLASQPSFSRSLLDPYIFPDGKSFFDERNSQYRGIWPAIIHNNWIVGTSNKINRLHDWNLASVEKGASECTALESLPFPRLPFVQVEPVPMKTDSPKILGAPPKVVVDPPPIPWEDTSVPFPFELKLRVFTSTNPTALQRCLDSLSVTEFENDGPRISIEISIDHPAANPSEAEVQGWSEVHTVASSFRWRGGPIRVIEQPHAIGASGQFLRGWTPNPHSDTELMLFIDDSAVLAAGWYKWLKRAVIKYGSNPDQFDPRLMGISLNVQSQVLGETYLNRYAGEESNSGRTPYDILNKRSPYYKYQLFSSTSTATLLFPQHWRIFLDWIEENHVDPQSALGAAGSTPCVPTMISNKWWSESATKHWYQWINRFNFEHGYFFLYTNFNERHALAVDGGASAQANERRMARATKIITDWHSPQLMLPSSPDIPVYDFHFNHVSTPDVLAWRKHIVSDRAIEQCWTMDRLAQKIRDDEAAVAAELQAKEEAKAKIAAEKKEKAKAEKAEKDRLNKLKKDAEKAEKDAAAKVKKEKEAAEKKKKSAEADAAKKDGKKEDKKAADKKKATDKKDDKKDEKKVDKSAADKSKSADAKKRTSSDVEEKKSAEKKKKKKSTTEEEEKVTEKEKETEKDSEKDTEKDTEKESSDEDAKSDDSPASSAEESEDKSKSSDSE